MALLEREVPLAELVRLHEDARAGAGRLVWVEGEAGIGKTSLLGALRDALPRGGRLLIGACDPLSTPRPLGPIVDVAEALDPTLARLIAAGGSRGDVMPTLLAALRATPGLVLCLDDLHWADEATLDAIRFVGRRIASAPALVIGTYRDDEVGSDHPLRVVVGDLATSPAVSRLPLRALSPASVRELAAGSMLDPDEVHRLTGGNPFFVTEVIAGVPARLPPTVRDAVLARAARLSPAARATLEAAAVIGPVVEPGLLIRVVEPVAADECLDRGLLVARDGRYAFRHEVAREAILAAADPSVRIRLHARILAALEAEPGAGHSLALLAHHADAAGDRDAVLRYAVPAARQAAAVNANREAAAQFARAIRAAGSLSDVERAHLLYEYADAHGVIGRDDLALVGYQEAAEIWQRLGDPGREARALSRVASAFVGLGRNREADVASRRALDLVSTLPLGPERVEVLLNEAWLRMLDRDNGDAIAIGREVLAAGADVVSGRARATALNFVGAARILLDDPGGRDDLLEAIAISEREGIPRGVVVAYGNLGSAFGEMYRFADAAPYLEAGVRYATERDIDGSYQEAWLALVHLHRGQWREAGRLAGELARRAHLPTLTRIMALLALGRLKARRGDADAWTVLDEAVAVAEPTGTLQRIGPVRAARAEAAWLAGDLERAGVEAAAAFDLAHEHRHPWHVGELCWWMTRAGLPAPDTGLAAEPWRHLLAGRWREAAAAWTVRDCPYEAARAALAGDDATAIEAAHRTFDELGAGPAAAIAARRLRELGVRSIPRGRRPTTRANPAGLTARELEVLRLLVAGNTNGDIAARLVVSTRTVDHHVSAVLGKLGIERRGDAAAAADRLGIELQDGQPGAPG